MKVDAEVVGRPAFVLRVSGKLPGRITVVEVQFDTEDKSLEAELPVKVDPGTKVLKDWALDAPCPSPLKVDNTFLGDDTDSICSTEVWREPSAECMSPDVDATAPLV